RRGGRAIKKNGPKAPCSARTGWFVQATARIYSGLNEPPRRCELIVIRRYSPPCTTAAPPQGGVAASSKKIGRSHRSRRSQDGFPFGFIGKPPRPRDKQMLRDISESLGHPSLHHRLAMSHIFCWTRGH